MCVHKLLCIKVTGTLKNYISLMVFLVLEHELNTSNGNEVFKSYMWHLVPGCRMKLACIVQVTPDARMVQVMA